MGIKIPRSNSGNKNTVSNKHETKWPSSKAFSPERALYSYLTARNKILVGPTSKAMKTPGRNLGRNKMAVVKGKDPQTGIVFISNNKE